MKNNKEEKILCVSYSAEENYEMKYVLYELRHRGYCDYSVFLSVSGHDYYDETTVESIAVNKGDAYRIYKALCDGAVTPKTARDVIEDMI